MPDTFSQIYIQTVFAVQNRQALINSSWEQRLFKFITGIIKNKDQKLIAINGMPDHVHLFIGIKPDCKLSDLMRDVKRSSSLFITENGFTKYKFNWQSGYGAFSYGQSQIDSVVKYIMNQKEHHKKYSFKDEYISLLKKFQIEHNEQHLFNWI